jgi:hypothetical protein
MALFLWLAAGWVALTIVSAAVHGYLIGRHRTPAWEMADRNAEQAALAALRVRKGYLKG